ncbi:hypothetical protein MZO44_16690, partial [Lactiplantibacillus sp. E932]|nr:hypothetical protein [Lactiplantibacillus sp. E932]
MLKLRVLLHFNLLSKSLLEAQLKLHSSTICEACFLLNEDLVFHHLVLQKHPGLDDHVNCFGHSSDLSAQRAFVHVFNKSFGLKK